MKNIVGATLVVVQNKPDNVGATLAVVQYNRAGTSPAPTIDRNNRAGINPAPTRRECSIKDADFTKIFQKKPLKIVPFLFPKNAK
ncbi:MAG: hypothetical protein NC827_01580, partial [Candidatus Omnitrophica bacterium]|nr:hypothetical protein [Candidatus Omnitrophota bacterium]